MRCRNVMRECNACVFFFSFQDILRWRETNLRRAHILEIPEILEMSSNFFLSRNMEFGEFCPEDAMNICIEIVFPSKLLSLQNMFGMFFLIYLLHVFL